MDTKTVFNVWKNTVIGMGLDIDRAYGKQCVDPVLSWSQAIFPGIHYSLPFPPTQSAKDIFTTANPAYWEKITNNPHDINQLPIAGDVAVFAASPEPGFASTFRNDDGTIGIVDHADAKFIWLIHQDSTEANPVVRLKQRPHRYTRLIGWLRPKVPAAIPQNAVVAGPTTDPRIGKQVWLKPVKQWSVYRRGQFPDRAKRIGYLRPDQYNHGPGGQPGLTYPIEGVSQYQNTVSITSDAYGPVDIYLDADAVIL